LEPVTYLRYFIPPFFPASPLPLQQARKRGNGEKKKNKNKHGWGKHTHSLLPPCQPPSHSQPNHAKSGEKTLLFLLLPISVFFLFSSGFLLFAFSPLLPLSLPLLAEIGDGTREKNAQQTEESSREKRENPEHGRRVVFDYRQKERLFALAWCKQKNLAREQRNNHPPPLILHWPPFSLPNHCSRSLSSPRRRERDNPVTRKKKKKEKPEKENKRQTEAIVCVFLCFEKQ
jgi:hypothetical protein